MDFPDNVVYNKIATEYDKKQHLYYVSHKSIVNEFILRYRKNNEETLVKTFLNSFSTFIDIKTLLLLIMSETRSHNDKYMSNALLAISSILAQHTYDTHVFPCQNFNEEIFKISLDFVDRQALSESFSVAFSSLISKIEISKGFSYAARRKKRFTFYTSEKSSFEGLPSIDELARQLTIREYEIFCRMKPNEFFGVSWRRTPKLSPNIHVELQEFDKVSLWVANVIVGESKVEKRAEWIVYFLKLAQALLDLRNFQTLFAIIGGLTSASVFRLHKTFDLLDIDSKDLLEKFRSIISIRTNFALHRGYLKNEEGKTCVPFMGMILSDLKAIREGYDANLAIKDDSLIHWMSLMQEYREVIEEIVKWQTVGFPTVEDPKWIKYEDIQKSINRNFDSLIDWKKLYQISVDDLEPRV